MEEQDESASVFFKGNFICSEAIDERYQSSYASFQTRYVYLDEISFQNAWMAD